MTKPRDDNTKETLDPAGARGGDTGPSEQLGKGPQAEKGDQRRHNPVHTGPTRQGSQGTAASHGHRSGSESNASQ